MLDTTPPDPSPASAASATAPTAAWKVAEAKNRLSEVLNRAEETPQVITRRDRGYVVIAQEKYRELVGEKPTLKDLILNGPSLEGLDLTRDPSPMREVDFGDAG